MSFCFFPPGFQFVLVILFAVLVRTLADSLWLCLVITSRIPRKYSGSTSLLSVLKTGKLPVMLLLVFFGQISTVNAGFSLYFMYFLLMTQSRNSDLSIVLPACFVTLVPWLWPFVILYFFLGWLHMRTVPVMSLLVFFGPLVASLLHSGLILALGSRPPWVFFPFCEAAGGNGAMAG